MSLVAAPAVGALRADAEALGESLPALLAEANLLATTVVLGDHGRRQAGMGDAFWQFRQAAPGDALRRIDWRRSARGDQAFVRETEWQAAQTVTLWVDRARSMNYPADPVRPSKAARARLLALALGILLLRGGERVGLSAQSDAAPRAGRGQIDRLALALIAESAEDYGAPVLGELASRGRAVLLSDFLGPLDAVERALARAADQGVMGVLMQVLDPTEEDFPFDGRTVFLSMGNTLRHETLRAGDLRARYLERLAERKARLAALARASGWHFQTHHTGQNAQSAMLWLYRAMERQR